MSLSMLTCIYTIALHWHSTSGGHGALRHVTFFSEHVSLSSHPPLSKSHDGSQNVSPVGWYTLHCDPLGQVTDVQAEKLRLK